MLNVLLNSDYNPDRALQRVYFLQPKAILKLYNLKVGNERSSSQCVIQKMIKRFAAQCRSRTGWFNHLHFRPGPT